MRSINKVILVGNITRDPQIRKTTNGQTIVTFGLATNREWVGSDRQKQSLAEYHNIVAWGRLAELCEELLKKGKLVYIEGYLKTRSWDHESGVKIFRTEIVANDMIMLEKRAPSDEGNDPETEENSNFEEDVPQADGSSDPLNEIDDDFFSDIEDASEKK